MKQKNLLFLILFLSLTGCIDKVQLPVSAPELVVEGWIEDGGFPVVMVTTTVPVTDTIADVSELQEHVVNWAKVTVSDGEREVLLSGQKDNNYFPTYI